jgi:excisionase family DNA binding protein
MIRGPRPNLALPLPPTALESDMEPLTVRISAAVKLTGISRSRIYELIQSGDLTVKKVGRSTLIPYAALKKYLGLDES